VRDLQQAALLDRVDLGPLSFSESSALAASILREQLSVSAQAQLFETTEGQPLFIVEAVRAGLASGTPSFEASPRVQAVIGARLAQLSPAARSVTGLAATIGRAFDPEVLRQASDLDEEELVAALDELWQRAIIREPPQGTGSCQGGSHEGSISASMHRRLCRWPAAGGGTGPDASSTEARVPGRL